MNPIGHIKIAVSNFQTSLNFYKKLLEKLGWELKVEKEQSARWLSPEGLGLSLTQAEKGVPAYKFGAPGLHHFCYKVESKEKVDETYQFLTSENIQIFDPPQHYPEYTEKYYAVFFADPDGIKLEIAYY